LLVRSGQTAEAEVAYERAAGMGSVPAMTNRGNLALIEKDYAAAEKWFTQALEREPENEAAKRGLEQVGERGEQNE
jgi:Flp pilus assembly protein TadD